MAKIIVLIPLWKRHSIFRTCANNLQWFIKESEHEIEVVTILSPEDPEADKLFQTATRCKYRTIHYKNIPVSEKLNHGVNYCWKNIEFDYLMNLGSDDLIHPNIFKLYDPLILKKENFFGINNCFFYDTESDLMIHFNTYNHNRSIGAGRMIGRKIIGMILKNNREVYENNINRGLDGNSAIRITSYTSCRDKVQDAAKFPYIIDIKCGENINSFYSLRKLTNRIQYYKPDQIMKHYPHVLLSRKVV